MHTALRTRPIAVLATLAVLGAVSGCASTSEQPGSPVGEADGIVTVYGSISGNEAELLEQSWAEWEDANGIDILYEASGEFEAQVGIRAQTGNAPDLALFPQPGYISDLAALGYIQPAPEAVVANVSENWTSVWTEYGTTDGVLYAAPLTTTVEGFIWYSPSAFAQWGVTEPRDWDQLVSLTAAIKAKTPPGRSPWCAGFAADASSGSAGTDWIETVLIRQAGLAAYDKWANHEIAFTDPIVADAFATAGALLLDQSTVNGEFGGVDTINRTSIEEIAAALKAGECALYHEASFFESYLRNAGDGEITIARDGDLWAFLAPPMAGQQKALTVGGEFVAAFSNDADTAKVQEYLSSAAWANTRIALGGVISANLAADTSLITSPMLVQASAILNNLRTRARYDASDVMPSVVGAGAFLTGMTDWIDGVPVDDVLTTVEDSWPRP